MTPPVNTPKRKTLLTIRLGPEELRRLRQRALENERTISAEIRLAVRAYLAETA